MIAKAVKEFSPPRIIAPGETHERLGKWHERVTNDAYHGDTSALSRSGIIEAVTPAHFHAAWGQPTKETEALRIGSLTDLAVFERDTYKRTVFGMPDFGDGRTTEVKEQKRKWLASMPIGGDARIISLAEKTMIDAMAESVLAHPLVKRLMAKGRAQLSGWWVDPETGILCRHRPDWVPDDEPLLMDLKTAIDASRSGFAKAIVNHGYDVQADHYLAGASAVTGINYATWVFVVVEKTPPYPVAVYVADEALLARGRATRARVMRELRKCIETDTWPAYGEEAQTISLPNWALTSSEDLSL